MDTETICAFDGKRKWIRECHCFFSPFFPSFHPAADLLFLKWGLESGDSFLLVSATSWASLNLVKTALLLSLLRLPSGRKKKKRELNTFCLLLLLWDFQLK